ncbi:hypothetical protein BOFE_09350 (plasmid) [Candidatus Borrelia fainii]|uniref:Uncharacterized protein n=1 Tax=Candidatus Borrelia fainii TaxID=2518322 RepID=A0ABN6USN4_9SPIR|nr:hypothetical protein [Candidatus Borrelia fainii]BDU63395.1 hypothetical protein BOFE_09350 [Candidatus Borrelia fainii]
MLKIRHIISLLVLILLFISCNLKSPQREGIVRRGPKDPDFKKIGTGDGALGKPSEVVPLTGVRNSVPALAPTLAEVEKSLGVKLNELLDTFKVSKEGKISIVKIKDVVTDDKIGSDKRGEDKSDEDYKTYTIPDFRALLNELGAARVKDIIKFDLDVVETQKAALDAINNVQNPEKKQILQVLYDNKFRDYLLFLKETFSGVTIDVIHDGFVGDYYDNEFPAIETEARRIIENGGVYEILSDHEKTLIDKIQNIITDGSIGKGEGYKTYTIPDFRALLNELGHFKVQKIIELAQYVNSLKDGRLVTRIESIKDEILREKLRVKYDDKLSKYPLHLKKVFSESSADAVYANFISNDYTNEFIMIDSQARQIIKNGDVYAKLSDQEKFVIGEIQNIVTDNRIGIGEGYKTYTIPEFRALLNELGYVKVQKILKLGADVDYLKEGDLVARIDSIKDEILRTNLRTRFDNKLKDYQLYLKKVFSKSSADDVYANVISSEYDNEFSYIEAKAVQIIENGDVYEKFSDYEKTLIDKVRNIVIDGSIGNTSDYKTYTIPEFRALLNDLGYAKVQEIIKVYFNVEKVEREIVNMLNNLDNEELKLKLEAEFNGKWNSFLLRFKKLFSKFDGYTVYDKVMQGGYVKELTEFQMMLDEL